MLLFYFVQEHIFVLLTFCLIQCQIINRCGWITAFAMSTASSFYSLDNVNYMCCHRLAQISDDTEDLESALKKGGEHAIIGNGKCSALVKLLDGNKELFVAHDTWSGYNSMLRILKKYSFGYHVLPG